MGNPLILVLVEMFVDKMKKNILKHPLKNGFAGSALTGEVGGPGKRIEEGCDGARTHSIDTRQKPLYP